MRNIGLDIARSLAIIMVLISHSQMFFTKFNENLNLSISGVLGVELFFVLSGFLIGGIIIREFIVGNGSLLRFYSRRWMRTLPAYFLVLIILIIIATKTGQAYYFEHFFFIQNFNWRHVSFFPVSWSLSIEEWFYLLIPLCLVFLKGIKTINKKQLFFVFCIGVIVVSVFAKIIYTYQYNPLWDSGVRKHVFLRMDSLMFGVLLAGIKYYYRNWYDRFSSTALFTISVIMVASISLYYIFVLKSGGPRIDHSIVGRTVLFDFISASFALMIWSLEKSNKVNLITDKVRNIFVFISITSYSVYLIHYDIFRFIANNFNAVHSIIPILLILFGSIFGVYILAYMLYRYWEKPFMDIRDRKKKSIQTTHF